MTLVQRVFSAVLAIVTILFLSVFVKAEIKNWPRVAPIEKSFYFSEGKAAEVKLSILSTQEEPAYILECHTFAYEGDPSFDYSGDFECRLVSAGTQDTYSTLLTDVTDQSRDWQSRGRFLAEELEGACRHYPEFGQVRHFRLRGVKITFTIHDVEFRDGLSGMKPTRENGPLFKSFQFRVQVESDATAASEIAEPIPYAYPARKYPNTKDMSLDCEIIRRKQ